MREIDSDLEKATQNKINRQRRSRRKKGKGERRVESKID